MQQPATVAFSPNSSSFSGLLAELADAEPRPGKKLPPARDFDGLEDDVATLSYEHALRAHARYRPGQDQPRSQTPAAESAQAPISVAPPESHATKTLPAQQPASALERRKSASVTVRLSEDENECLHRRASEAGMTVSAYLRSCAFEVETLRAQVKQTLAEMRQVGAPPEQLSLWHRILPWKTRARAPR